MKINNTYYFIISLILSVTKLIGQANNNIVQIEVIEWSLGDKVNWNSFDPSHIEFTCQVVQVNSNRKQRQLTKKLSNLKKFRGKVGSKVFIKYTLVFKGEYEEYSYGILSNGMVLHKEKRYKKVRFLNKQISRFFEQETAVVCDCPNKGK